MTTKQTKTENEERVGGSLERLVGQSQAYPSVLFHENGAEVRSGNSNDCVDIPKDMFLVIAEQFISRCK